MLKKIISGGQTGVDRAALDVAISLSLLYGGWCPKGRLDENGIIPNQYINLVEVKGDFQTEEDNYAARTKLNICDAHGTLILLPSSSIKETLQDGTLLTLKEVKRQKKSSFLIDLTTEPENILEQCRDWLKKNHIEILNVAGPRESSWPGIYQRSYSYLHALLQHMDFKRDST
ncbi:Putative molybdenum carrier [Legionella lansingensis]|uniref:Putative molybdenum carrier n=1 Tax=Legionella lansingensis TaxID=45067 RepID=A0A0W0VMD5_9GAMM|nr:putative molybdenum carrier protein [Legionella lansingensis]KTD20966.1 putative molybdenum carrier [Legionella lansingensis]SNV44605.1 Putative molybdenum carrier [Legionella lansingensis]